MANATMRTVVGVFKDYATAQTVAQELEGAGFPAEDVRVSGAAGKSYATSQGQHTGEDEGGIAGFFRRIFGSDADEEETGYYEKAVQSGNAVVTVDADESRMNYAVEIMNRHGALDIEKNVTSSAKRGVQGQGQQSIPVVEEELQVGKRAVQRGGVRIYSRVIDRPVEEQVTLREEHVRVERRPVDRPVSAADTAQLRDQTIEVTEMAEEPVVSKRARVVEEVAIGKETTERTETIRENVRRTDVKVEKAEPQQTGRTTGDYDADFRKDFETRYAGSSGKYESYAPAYQYGYNIASDPRFKDKSWGEVESTFKTDYLRNNPTSTWDNMKGAVRYGWEKVTGKRS